MFQIITYEKKINEKFRANQFWFKQEIIVNQCQLWTDQHKIVEDPLSNFLGYQENLLMPPEPRNFIAEELYQIGTYDDKTRNSYINEHIQDFEVAEYFIYLIAILLIE